MSRGRGKKKLKKYEHDGHKKGRNRFFGICLGITLTAAALTGFWSTAVYAGEWSVSEEDQSKTYTAEELDIRITFPAGYVASELSGEIAARAGNAVLEFAVADHPVDMDSNVTAALGSCKMGETIAPGNSEEIAAYYRQFLLMVVRCTEREPLAQVELGGYSYWKLSVREANGLFLYPMNMDFYLRDMDDRIVILGFAYYDEWAGEVEGILGSVAAVNAADGKAGTDGGQ